MARAELPRMTLEEFHDWADRQDGAYEFVDGLPVPLYPEPDGLGGVRAMAATTNAHGLLAFTCARALDRRRPAGCKVLGARVGIATRERTVREPDAVLNCGELEPKSRAVSLPVLVVEVLSPNTADADRGPKLEEYKALPSVREIWLVDSARRYVTVWHRREGGWFVTDTIAQGAFASDVLGATIELVELYDDLEL